MKTALIDLILDRRSVRAFSDRPVEDEKLRQIVECGMYARSSRNKQGWHFTVITRKETIEEINRLTIEGMDRLGMKKEPEFHAFHHAPVILILSSALEGFSEINCGCALENMALAAKALGLDSCIVAQTRFMYHQANAVDLNRLLKIPEGFEHDAALCIGYREGPNPEAKPRREGVVDYIR